MKRKSCLIAFAVSTSLVTGCGTDAQLKVRAVGAQAVLPVDDLIAQGRVNFARNNVALALDQFRRAVRLQPENLDALNGLAACYDRLGRFDLSRLHYEKALALAPTSSKTLHNLQVSLTMQGRKDEAMALAREAAQPRPAIIATEAVASSTGPGGVTVVLPPPAAPAMPPPAAPKLRSVEQIAAAQEEAPTGPRLERVSLAEVELVTAPTAKQPGAKQRPTAKPRTAGRIIQVTRAELVKQTPTGSEWVFPDAPAKAAAPTRTPKPAAAQPTAPSPVVEVAAVASPSPSQPAVRMENVPAPTPTATANATVAVATSPVVAPPVAAVARAPRSIAKPAVMTVVPARTESQPAPPPARPARLASVPVRAATSVDRMDAPTGSTRVVAASAPAKPAKASTRVPVRGSIPATAPRVQVLNAVGRKGLAGRYSVFLKSRGWAGLRPADARRMRRSTVILYPAGSRAQAALLARRLPFRAVLSPTKRGGSGLLLVLGSDALAFDNRLRQRVARA